MRQKVIWISGLCGVCRRDPAGFGKQFGLKFALITPEFSPVSTPFGSISRTTFEGMCVPVGAALLEFMRVRTAFRTRIEAKDTTMRRPFGKLKSGLRSSVAAGLLFAVPSMALAQDVNLRSPDGNLDLSGELIEYQDNTYVLRTDIGAIRVRGDQVECFGVGCPNTAVLDDEVTIAGSDTVGLSVIPILLSGYAGHLEAEQEVTEKIGTVETVATHIGNNGFGDLIGSFRVRSTVSSDGFANLLGKSAEIGMSSRRIRKDEARTLKEYGAGSMVSADNEHIVATDSIVVITHPNNPVKSLSFPQLAAIYSGQISNWSEVGGIDAPINAVQLSRGSGTRSVFETRVLGDSVGASPVNAITATGNQNASDVVYQDENAIGYVSFAFIRGNTAQKLVDSCGLTTESDLFSAKSGEYPLQRPLYLYTRQDTLHETATDFLKWTQSSDADGAVAKSGFIDLGVSRAAQGSDSTRADNLRQADLLPYEADIAAEFINLLDRYDRLSTTLRFRAASNRMTPQSRASMERLVNYLERLPESEVVLVGFTDDVGPFDGNLAFAEERASLVENELRALGQGRLSHIKFASKSYGELAPVACNASENGRAINRRVEVWIKNPES